MIHINLKSHNFDCLIAKHEEYIKAHIANSYSKSQNSFFEEDKAFFEYYLGKTPSEAADKLLKICTTPDLVKVIDEFEDAYYSCFDKHFKTEALKRVKSKTTESRTTKNYQIYKYLTDIFNYKGFNEGTKKWNRHIFLSELGVRVCPYCNRNYITSYEKDSLKTTADADHYYPKSLYPILQMNLYNMVPSCNVCNSKMKGNKDIRHLYPYTDLSGSLKFSTNTDTLESLYNFTEDSIEVNITSCDANNVRAQNSITMFKLDRVYKIHNDIIFRLIRKIHDYKTFQEGYYIKMLGDELSGMILEGDNVHSYWFDFLQKDPLEEPLAKIKQDIYEQFNS